MVFEFDSRINTKEVCAAATANPGEFMRTKIAEQYPNVSGITLYGLKKLPRPQDHMMLQIIGKIGAASRPYILEHSALGPLSSRDYVQKGQVIDDLTTLPRFFPATNVGKEEALRVASKLPGFCGLAMTKRGLAIRSWAKDLRGMRTAILASDPRITEENAAVFPKLQYESIGWPASISPGQVVHACLHATKAAPIPTRCFRSMGVTTWVLLFQDQPSRFTAAFNSVTVEIILSPLQGGAKQPQKKQKPSKKANGRAVGDQPASSVPRPDIDESNNRISMLESRMNLLETKQESLESRMMNQFDQVQDSLRQVLAHVAPRSPNHGSTGCTPPPKQAKVNN